MKTNKKTFRRIACLVLVICFSVLALASCGQSVPNAADANGTFGSIAWEYKKDTNTLTLSGAGEIGNVSKDEDNAPWAGDVRLSTKKIVIAEGVTSIGTYAFWGFANATEIVLPSSLLTIGDFAFAYCGKLSNIILPNESLTTIGAGAFEGCASLGSIFVPNTVVSVGDYAFAYCYNMKNAIVAAKSIGAYAFKNCRSLEQLTLVPELTADKIGNDAFLGASKNFESANKEGNATGVSIITIKHVWSDGTPVAVPEGTLTTWELAYGASKAFTSLDVADAKVDSLSQTATGNGAPQTITFTYTKNTPVPETPADTEAAPETPTDTEPQEDEGVKPSTIIAIVIMAIVLVGIGVGAFFLIRSDKKNGGKNGTVRKNNKK
ncbi:MAG: leucine-rich repeat domain-containing protein [Clostridia bacterium]|nr:leucine-rich repeat domain-containing protein [Clostridia bacterium]